MMLGLLVYLVLGIIVIETVVPFWGLEKIIAAAVWPIVLPIAIWMAIREARRPAIGDYELLCMVLALKVMIEAEMKKNEDWRWN